MQRFRYTALDGRGDACCGMLDADYEAEAAAELKSRGLFPTSLSPAVSEIPSSEETTIPAMLEKALSKPPLIRPCEGLLGMMWGHTFQPVYDAITTTLPGGVVTTKEIYVESVCNRCGQKSNRRNEKDD